MKLPSFRLFHEIVAKWSQDNVMRMSAALAYYAVFSISPLLIIVLSTAGYFFGQDAVRGQLNNELTDLMGEKAALSVQEMVKSASHPQQSLVATAVGIATLVFGATGLFVEMKDALNTIWGLERIKVRGSIWGFIRTRLLSFGMVVVILFLLLVSMVLTAVFAYMSQFFAGHLNLPPAVWGWMGFGVALTCEIILFGVLFMVLPDAKNPLLDVWVGAGVTALLFEAGKWALAWYLGRESTASSFGAAGSLVVLLMWIYYSAMIVLTGAEFTQAMANRHHRKEAADAA